MTKIGDAIAEAARNLTGARFRLHGRNPSTGLDCVGTVFVSLNAVGANPVAPNGYSLRNASIDRFARYAKESGLKPVSDAVEAGDVLLVGTGPAQVHLLIAIGGQEFVHADAGLRMVTTIKAPFEWDLLKHWRFQD